MACVPFRGFMFFKIMPSNLSPGYHHGKDEPRLSDEQNWYIVTLSILYLWKHLTFLVQYAALPAGIIRGALSRLGFQGTVVPEITSLPQCTYFLAKVCRC
jgi:hypothetical protein